MSKIAELLKLAEKKKADKPKADIAPFPDELVEPGVSKSNQVGDGVSKSNEEGGGVSRSNQVGDGVSRSNEEGGGVSKSKQDEVNTKRNDTVEINKTRSTVEISPTRNFTKVSNSIMKRAIPEKYFRGLSKHTYDVLYQRTRGAIKPARTIQLTKDELVRLTGLSKDAIKLHIKYLKETGLLDSRPVIGNHSGWEYEIFVPEELTENSQVGVRQGKVRQGKIEQDKASEDLPLHSEQTPLTLTHTNLIENKEVKEDSNTSLKNYSKNKTYDDEAFADFIDKFQEVSEELTGKKLSKRDGENLGKLADLLILELKIAARRANNVSSIPAFLTEVLRRQFFVSRQHQPKTGKIVKTKSDMVGKPDDESFEIKPLDEKGREVALEHLREFTFDDFLQDFKRWYTAEDWQWMMKELEINQKKPESK